jgi:hypothetical protein
MGGVIGGVLGGVLGPAGSHSIKDIQGQVQLDAVFDDALKKWKGEPPLLK